MSSERASLGSATADPGAIEPRTVVFTDAYPTTATGKVRRIELRDLAAAALVVGAGTAEAVS
jgi:acyl-coenzyme A synthetase/AMP-(fatty) acid ligase